MVISKGIEQTFSRRDDMARGGQEKAGARKGGEGRAGQGRGEKGRRGEWSCLEAPS